MALLSFAVVLLLAVLVSQLANRTILSTSVIFLIAGITMGTGGFDVLHLTPDDQTVQMLAELALFAVLFTDGMKLGWTDLRSAWRLPGRALVLGLPLTLLITAVLAKLLAGVDWPTAFLIGAILSPTDPVFASALVGNDKVPYRLRHLLNVESGINDGLALPFVIILMSVVKHSQQSHASSVALELVLGIVIGIAIPWLALKLEQTRFFSASHRYEPLTAVAIGLLVLALGQVTHANLFLAAFAAGITVATIGPSQKRSFEQFGELVSELLKLAALLVFGALITWQYLVDMGVGGWVFAVLALFLARPAALTVSFLGSGLSAREQIAASWFGPKGFASVVYALLVLSNGAIDNHVFHVLAITVALSILLHSSTDVVVGKWFDSYTETPHWHGATTTTAEPADRPPPLA